MVKSVAQMAQEATAEEAEAAAEMRALEDKIEQDPGTPEFQPKAAAEPKAKKEKKVKEPKEPKAEGEAKKPGRKAAAPDTALYARTAKAARAGSTAEAIVNALTGDPKTIDNWVTESGRARGDVQAAVRAGYLELVGGEKPGAETPADGEGGTPEDGGEGEGPGEKPDAVLE